MRLWYRDHCDPYTDVTLPDAPVELVVELARRYITLYERITGQQFAVDEMPALTSSHLRAAVASALPIQQRRAIVLWTAERSTETEQLLNGLLQVGVATESYPVDPCSRAAELLNLLQHHKSDDVCTVYVSCSQDVVLASVVAGHTTAPVVHCLLQGEPVAEPRENVPILYCNGICAVQAAVLRLLK